MHLSVAQNIHRAWQQGSILPNLLQQHIFTADLVDATQTSANDLTKVSQCLDNPIHALLWLWQTLRHTGQSLQAGDEEQLQHDQLGKLSINLV